MKALDLGSSPFDVLSDRWVDRSGFGNHGKVYGAKPVSIAPGIMGYKFKSDNSYTNCSNSDTLKTTGDRSLLCWIKLTTKQYPNANTNWYIACNESYKNYGFLWRIDGETGKQYFRTNQADNSTSLLSNTPIGNKKLRFISSVIKQGILTFYMDEIEDGSGNIQPEVKSQDYFHISYYSQGLDGLLFYFMFYPYATTKAQIKDLYHNSPLYKLQRGLRYR